MRIRESPQQLLQQLLDCYAETSPDEVLRSWADAGWAPDQGAGIDEACLKYIALVLLDSIAHRARRTILERDCPALVDAGEETHMLPAAPGSLLSRGLELVREMCGLGLGSGRAELSLGLRDSSLELRIIKSEALHIVEFPVLREAATRQASGPERNTP